MAYDIDYRGKSKGVLYETFYNFLIEEYARLMGDPFLLFRQSFGDLLILDRRLLGVRIKPCA
jgi:hypothetical protein